MIILGLTGILLGGCEPLRGVVSQKDIQAKVDTGCVDATLRKTFLKIERSDYVDDGSTFPKGADVAQFTYYRAEDGAGWVSLGIGRIGNKTRITHSFTGVGAELPQQTFPPAIRAMDHAARALRASCGLDLSDMKLVAVGRDVDALK